MWKACSRCGKVHRSGYKCTANMPPKTPTYDQQLRSTSRWQRKREEIKESSKYLCALCLQEGRYNYESLEVHHIEKLKNKPEKLLDNYNLICLCKQHHEQADEGKIKASYLKELAKAREEGKYPPTHRGRAET